MYEKLSQERQVWGGNISIFSLKEEGKGRAPKRLLNQSNSVVLTTFKSSQDKQRRDAQQNSRRRKRDNHQLIAVIDLAEIVLQSLETSHPCTSAMLDLPPRMNRTRTGKAGRQDPPSD